MKGIGERIKQHKILFAILVALIVIGFASIVIRSRQRGLGDLSEPLKKGTIVESVYGIGTVTAQNSYQLKVGATDGIANVFVREGDRVRRGQKLLVLDGGTSFVAPFSGTVTYLPVKVGETVFPQAIVMSLVDLLDRYIIVSVEQRGAIRVRQGQTAKISFDSIRELIFDGVVQSVYSNESNFLVRIKVASLPPQLLPGMTADVAITIGEHPDVLLIPVAAIEGGQVFVKRGRRRQTIDVKIGIVDGAFAQVLSGDLQEGEQLYLKRKTKP